MSMLDRSASPEASAAESVEQSDRLSVITAGRIGNMDALLGANGFDVVSVAQTEDALMDAVSTDEPDAIVVEADLCTSLEHVRDLAPRAVLIVIGDHTPAGALGRIEPGVSGTVMAGLLHALVAEGVGGAVVWGLVPALGSGSALQVPQRIIGWLSARPDLVRAHVANALRDHAELLTAATVAAVTVSAGLLLTLSAARTHEPPPERPERVHVVAPAVERTQQHPVVGVSPTTPMPVYNPFWKEAELGDRPGSNPGESRGRGRGGQDGHGQDGDDHGQDGDDHGQDGDDHGQDGDDHGQAGDDHGQDGDDHGQDGDDHGQDGDDHGRDGDDQDGGGRATGVTRRTR